MSSVLKIMRTPLSDSDIRKILGNDIKIIVYPDLSKYSNLGDLLPANRDCCIILYELKQLSGHWTCLTRDGDLFTFFDSYGLKPDSELRWISSVQRSALNENTPYLSNLLKNERYIYNRIAYQESDNKIETCGDHVCSFLYCFMNYNMNLEQYEEFMKKLKGTYHQSYDFIVANFVKSINQ